MGRFLGGAAGNNSQPGICLRNIPLHSKGSEGTTNCRWWDLVGAVEARVERI